MQTQGKAYKKSKQVAIIEANLQFRTAVKKTAQTSHKKKKWAKFAAITKLDGVPDEVFQDIANDYEKMLATRFEAMGLAVIPYSEITEKKSYKKLLQKSQVETTVVKKNWETSKIFTPNGRPFLVYNIMKPFGPHAKLPKELKSILYN